MKRVTRLSQRLWNVFFVPIVMFFLFGTVKCSQLADQSVQAPVAMAAQQTAQSPASSVVSGQPFIAVAKQAKAAVVNISSVKKRGAEGFETPFFDDPFFRRFFGEEFERRNPLPREYREQGLGSGVMVTPDG